MKPINLRLMFDGNCLEAFLFYKSIFGGEFGSHENYKNMPDIGFTERLPETERDNIMMISLRAGRETLLTGTDYCSLLKKPPLAPFPLITVRASSIEEANNWFESLACGGNVSMPMRHTLWESYFGVVTDKFGKLWVVHFN